MKILLVAMTGLFTNLLVQAQSFKKYYGTNYKQQVLHNLSLNDDGKLYTCGFFKENPGKGTISKLDTAGNLFWYRSYLPSDAFTNEGYLINSVFRVAENAVFAFGAYLGESQRSGYIVQKMNDNGDVLWAKFIQDSVPAMNTKAIYANGAIYTTTYNKLIKINLNGEVVNSVKINGMVLGGSDLFFTSSHQVVVSAKPIDQQLDGSFSILCFGENLQYIYGHNCSYVMGAISPMAMTETTENGVIVSVHFEGIPPIIWDLRMSAAGEIVWARKYEENFPDPDAYKVMQATAFKPLNSDLTEYYRLSPFFYYENNGWSVGQRSGLVRLNSDGKYLQFKYSPASIGTLFPSDLEIDLATNSFYTSESWLNQDRNCVRRGNIDELGCDEVEDFYDMTDETAMFSTLPFDSTKIIPGSPILSVLRTLIVTDLPIDIDEMVCSNTSPDPDSDPNTDPNPDPIIAADPSVAAPNVFTPNGDGQNDFFELKTTQNSAIKLIITNRWGNTVFEQEGVSPKWDGKTQNGSLVEEGVYFYAYTTQGVHSALKGHGFVEVIR